MKFRILRFIPEICLNNGGIFFIIKLHLHYANLRIDIQKELRVQTSSCRVRLWNDFRKLSFIYSQDISLINLLPEERIFIQTRICRGQFPRNQKFQLGLVSFNTSILDSEVLYIKQENKKIIFLVQIMDEICMMC